jgi:hypothetical protein
MAQDLSAVPSGLESWDSEMSSSTPSQSALDNDEAQFDQSENAILSLCQPEAQDWRLPADG